MVPWREIKYSIGQWLKHYPIRIIKKKNVKSGFRNSLLLIFFQAANWLDSDWTSENKGSDHSRVFHFFRFVFDSSFPSFNYFFFFFLLLCSKNSTSESVWHCERWFADAAQASWRVQSGRTNQHGSVDSYELITAIWNPDQAGRLSTSEVRICSLPCVS